jgi:hypothetical protein
MKNPMHFEITQHAGRAVADLIKVTVLKEIV